MKLRNEPDINRLDEAALVTEIKTCDERIQKGQENQSILDQSLLNFSEAAYQISREMDRLQKVIEDEMHRKRAALKKLMTINHNHPLVEGVVMTESLPAPRLGWRARVKKLFGL